MRSIEFCVADSGGTTTTWMLALTDGSYEVITTAGLHPAKVLADPQLLHEAVVRLDHPPANIPTLFFYGTGLMNVEKAEAFAALLHAEGFRHTEVFSDGLGACRALLSKTSGTVAILGTGSVVMEYDGSEICAVRGGLGALIGDEGSAFYFGKLVIKDYFMGRLDGQKMKAVNSVSGTPVRSLLSSTHAISEIAGLAALLDRELFHAYHVRNIESFVQAHFPEQFQVTTETEILELQVSGGYGSALHGVLSETVSGYGIRIGHVVDNPSQLLYSYHKTVQKK